MCDASEARGKDPGTSSGSFNLPLRDEEEEDAEDGPDVSGLDPGGLGLSRSRRGLAGIVS